MNYSASLRYLIAAILLGVAACGDDDTPEVLPPAPSLSVSDNGAATAAPDSVVTITLTAQAESGITSITANGDAVSGVTAGATSANVPYSFTVPSGAADGSTIDITFVLTDGDSRTAEETFTITVAVPETPTDPTDVLLSGDIEEDRTLMAGRYILTDDLDVQDGATLTLQAGVVILARHADDQDGDDPDPLRLTVEEGGTLIAQGTAENPVVMTSERTVIDGTDPAPGDWVGLRINGQAGVSSGSLQYVRIEYGGEIDGDDTESALRLQEVDAATTIDYLQVFRSLEMGIDMRGGSVNLKHLMLTECTMSSIEFDDQDNEPYNGNIQYFIVQSSLFPAKDARDLEIRDGAGVTIANMTMIGSGAEVNEGDLAAVRVRGSADRFVVFNSLVAEYSDDGLRLDDTGGIAGLDGDFVFAHSYIFRIGDDATRDDADPESGPLPFETEPDTYVNTISAEEIPAAAAGIGIADYTPGAAITSAYNSGDLGDFFDEASFVGAVGPTDWTSGWSVDADGNANP